MNTSYFSKSWNLPTAVSIAGRPPYYFLGRREYKKLAPKIWFFNKYKLDRNETFYTQQFKAEVLDKLDPQEVLRDLGEDAIILCYEKPGRFCHRHIVARWLEEKLGLEIKELD